MHDVKDLLIANTISVDSSSNRINDAAKVIFDQIFLYILLFTIYLSNTIYILGTRRTIYQTSMYAG